MSLKSTSPQVLPMIDTTVTKLYTIAEVGVLLLDNVVVFVTWLNLVWA